MKSLDETLSTSLEERYVADMSAWIGLGTLETGLPPAGAPAVQRAAWWNLTGTDDNLVVPLLPPAPTPGAAMLPGVSGGTAGSVAALFPMLRAVATFQMQLTGNLAAIDALIAAPFGLFPMEHAAPGVFASLDPGAQMTVLLGLFYALNWCRELASAFAPAFASTPSQESSQSLMKGMLLLRLRAACQLEAALAALLPMAPVAFHLPSLAKAAAGQGGVKANARSKKGPAKKKTAAVKVGYTEDGGDAVSEGTALQEDSGEHGGNADTRSNISNETRATAAAGGMARGEGSADGELPAAERLKLRSLQLSAVQALVIGKEMGTYLSLGPAAYLLADLAGKLRASLAAPKKATFLRPASQAAPTAVSAEAMLGMLRSIYPAMRHYLATGATVLEGGMADADMEAKDAPVLASWMSIAPSSNLPDLLQVLPDCESAAAAVAPSVAAGRVVTHALECFRLLFTFHAVAAPEHRTSLRAMLSALAPMPDGGSQPSSAAIDALPDPSQTWTPKQLLQGLVHAFSFFLQLAPVEEEVTVIFAEMERWPVILAILEALASVSRQLADEVAADDPKTAATWAKRMSTMHAKLAASAKHMLCHSWPAAAGSESASAGGWRGRAAALSAAVRIAVTYATDPIAQLSEFLHEVVSEVTTAPSGKSNAEPLADWPSMSGMTLITWYKALWDALLARWTEVVDSAAAIGKAPDAAPDAAAAIFAAVGACCEAFSDIVQVVRVQDRRPMLHIPAAKGAAVFLAGVKRVMPFWGAMFQENQEGIMVSVRCMGNALLGFKRGLLSGGMKCWQDMANYASHMHSLWHNRN